MASQTNDWQSKKSFLQCSALMLQNQINCDVWFDLPGKFIDEELQATAGISRPQVSTTKDHCSKTIEELGKEFKRYDLREGEGANPFLTMECFGFNATVAKNQPCIQPTIEASSTLSATTVISDDSDNQLPASPPNELGAHKFVLIARSPVFQTMLEERWQDCGHTLKIEDIERDAFKQFLQYVN